MGKGAGHGSSPWGPATLTDWPGLRAPGPGLAQAQMLQALGGGTSKGKTPVSVSLSALKKKKMNKENSYKAQCKANFNIHLGK